MRIDTSAFLIVAYRFDACGKQSDQLHKTRDSVNISLLSLVGHITQACAQIDEWIDVWLVYMELIVLWKQ